MLLPNRFLFLHIKFPNKLAFNFSIHFIKFYSIKNAFFHQISVVADVEGVGGNLQNHHYIPGPLWSSTKVLAPSMPTFQSIISKIASLKVNIKGKSQNSLQFAYLPQLSLHLALWQSKYLCLLVVARCIIIIITLIIFKEVILWRRLTRHQHRNDRVLIKLRLHHLSSTSHIDRRRERIRECEGWKW